MAGQQKVISSTFNVSTVDETVSLQAQYAPNDNPTSSQIHNTWQEGDLYMRTKMTNETTWSDWHKIVGENGCETDFSFAISSNATSTNSSTPPSDCTSESSWYDTPQPVTEQKPYLWMRVKKKVWNESTQQYDVSSTSYARLSAEYNFIVDLVNEMTNLELDENGNTDADVDFYFKVQAYYGTRDVLNDCTITASCDDADVRVTTTAAKTTGIRVQISQGIDMTGTTDITVTVTHSTYGARTVVFTMAGIKDGKNAVLQELLPSLDAISFARQDDGSLTPANRSLSLSIKKTQGGVTTIQTLAEANLIIRWSASSMPATKSGGNNWGNETATGITWDNITMKIASGVAASNVYIAMFNSSGTLLDRETIPIIKDGKHGKNAFTVDLENEMTNVALTEDGNTLTAVDFYFKVQAFYGTTNVLSDNECTVSASCSDNNVELDTTYAKTSTGGIHVQVEQNVALANSTNITVTVAHTTYGTRTVVFTIAGVRGGANAVLQELLPSRDNITFARLASGGLTPSSRYLTLSIKKTQGGVTTIQSRLASGLTVKWSVSSMPASNIDGNDWEDGYATGITWSGNTMQIENTVDATNLYIAAFNGDGVLVDRETIPVIKDGNNGNDGEDAPAAFADPEKITIQCDQYGNVKAQVSTNVTFSLKVGSHNVTPSSVSCDSHPTNVTIDNGSANYIKSITVLTPQTASGIASGCTFTVTGTYDKKQFSAKVTVALIGSTQGEKGEQGEQGVNGQRGKMGRFFYYAGEFDSTDTTKAFIVNDAQAPYFSHGVNAATGLLNCHVYNPTNNGSYTMAQMWDSSSQSWNNAPWETMTNEFKYLITKAIFGDYAHFGACVINGDWLISIHGKLNGTSYAGSVDNPETASGNVVPYTLFDPVFPLGGDAPQNFLTKDYEIKNELKRIYGKFNGGTFGGITNNSVDYEGFTDVFGVRQYNTYTFNVTFKVNTVDYRGYVRIMGGSMSYVNRAVNTDSTSFTEESNNTGNAFSSNEQCYFAGLLEYKGGFSSYSQVYTYSENSTAYDTEIAGKYHRTDLIPLYQWAYSQPAAPTSSSSTDLNNGWSLEIGSGYSGQNLYICFGQKSNMITPKLTVSSIILSTDNNYNRFVPNYAVDLKTGRSYQNDAYIRGEIHASRGTFTGTITANDGNIGGFSIGEKELTNSDWQAGIDIAADSKVVKIGENAKGAMNTEDAILRAENTKTKSLSSDTYNTALYLNAQGAKYNYAFYGNGNGVLNGLVFGFKVNALSVAGSSDATYNLDLKDGATVIFIGSRTSGTASAYMPKISDIRKALGITSTSVKFAFEYALSNQTSGSGTVKLIFRSYPNGNSEYPYRTNFDNNYTGNNYELPMATGDYAKILLIWDGSEYKAFVIRYIDGGWGAND